MFILLLHNIYIAYYYSYILIVIIILVTINLYTKKQQTTHTTCITLNRGDAEVGPRGGKATWCRTCHGPQEDSSDQQFLG